MRGCWRGRVVFGCGRGRECRSRRGRIVFGRGRGSRRGGIVFGCGRGRERRRGSWSRCGSWSRQGSWSRCGRSRRQGNWPRGRVAIDYRDPQLPVPVHTVVVPTRVKTNSDCPVRGRLTVVFDRDNPYGLGRPVSRIEPPGDVSGKAIRGPGLAVVVHVKASVYVITVCWNTRVDAQVRVESLALTDGGRWRQAFQPYLRPIISR